MTSWRGFELVNKLPEIGKFNVVYTLSDDLSDDGCCRFFEPKEGDTHWQYHHDGKWREIGINPYAGHPDKMKSLECLEKRLVEFNELCARTTGLESFPGNNARRRAVLDDIKELRALTRIEYINLYSYDAWRNYVQYHGLPEDYPIADLMEPSVMQERVDFVRARLTELTDERDIASTDRTIKQLIEDNWENGEIVRYCRYMEEVDPEMDEDIALSAMKRIRCSVNMRLGRPENYTPKGMVRANKPL